MFGVVIHDYMTEMLQREFTFAYGSTKKKAAENAWAIFKAECDDQLSELAFPNGEKLTKKSFVARICENIDDKDGVFVDTTSCYCLYFKAFKIPNGGKQ